MGNEHARKILRSRGGLKITLNNKSGEESFMVEMPGGQRFLLKDGPGQVEINDGNGNTVKLETGGITIDATAKVTISAAHVEINSGMIAINAGMSNFSGVVKCDTLISNSVVSSSYSPGVGNVF